METPKELDRLFIICELTAEELRLLNPDDPLLAYDFDLVSDQEEYESLKKRFFDNFGPLTVVREYTSEEVFVILSLESYLIELSTALALQKMKRITA